MGGSSTKTTNTPPPWWSDAVKKSLSISDQINKVGYIPYQANEIAGMNPTQMAAGQGANDWMAAANGTRPIDYGRGMPQARTDASGVSGYGSYDGLLANLRNLKKTMRPQYNALTGIGGDLLGSLTRMPGQANNSIWNMALGIGNPVRGGGGGGGGIGSGGNPFDPPNNWNNDGIIGGK
jgi:hypothetical protein